MPLAFEGMALKVYEQTAMKSLLAREHSDQLWERLRSEMCNQSDIISLRSRVMNLNWDPRREAITAFSTNLRTMAMNLLDNISEFSFKVYRINSA